MIYPLFTGIRIDDDTIIGIDGKVYHRLKYDYNFTPNKNIVVKLDRVTNRPIKEKWVSCIKISDDIRK